MVNIQNIIENLKIKTKIWSILLTFFRKTQRVCGKHLLRLEGAHKGRSETPKSMPRLRRASDEGPRFREFDPDLLPASALETSPMRPEDLIFCYGGHIILTQTAITAQQIQSKA